MSKLTLRYSNHFSRSTTKRIKVNKWLTKNCACENLEKKNKKRMKWIWGGMIMSDETDRPELYTTGGRVSIASLLIITTWNSGQVSNGRRAVAFEYEQKMGEFDDLIFFFVEFPKKFCFFETCNSRETCFCYCYSSVSIPYLMEIW